MDGEILFVVSDELSESFIRRCTPYSCTVIPGDWRRLGRRDADDLGKLCLSWPADGVLIDSYGVTSNFLDELRSFLPDLFISLFDDQYSITEGVVESKEGYPVDLIVSYSFYSDAQQWTDCYKNSDTQLLIGPKYAPLRPEFSRYARLREGPIRRVLVTTGATNPNMALERIIEGVLLAASDVHIDVVQGHLSTFLANRFIGDNIRLHQGLQDLSPLMSLADLAVCAGGSTLYEVAANGLPAVVCPIVENQLRNSRSYACACGGIAIRGVDWSPAEVALGIFRLTTGDSLVRCSEASLKAVDGCGAARITEAIYRFACGEEKANLHTCP